VPAGGAYVILSLLFRFEEVEILQKYFGKYVSFLRLRRPSSRK
jgi:hypothetical protein